MSSEALGLARLAIDKTDSKPLQAITLALAAIATAPEGAGSESRRTAEAALAQAMSTKRIVSILSGHKETINAASVSADGRHALTASADGTAILWDVASATSKTMLRHPDAVMAVAFTGNDEEIVTGSFYGNIRWWKPNNSTEVVREFRITAAPPDIFEEFLAFERVFLKTLGLSHPGLVNDLPDDERRKIRGDWGEPNIIVGDASFSKELLNDVTISDIQFSANGRYAMVTNLRGVAAVWDLTTERRVLDLDSKKDRDSYEFTRDGRSVRAGEFSVDLPEADPPRKHEIVAAIGFDPSSFHYEDDPALYKPTFSAEIKTDQTVHVIQRLPNPGEFTNRRISSLLPEEGQMVIESDTMAISAGTLVSKVDTRDGRRLAARNLATGRQTVLPHVEPDDLLGSPQLSLDGKELTVLLGRLGKSVRIMRFATGADGWSVTSSEDIQPASDAASRQWILSDAGSFIAEVWRDDHTAGLLHVVTRHFGKTIEQIRKVSLSNIATDRRVVGLSADGTILATAGSSGEALHRLDGGATTLLQHGNLSFDSPIRRIRFLEDGRTALLITNSEITLYDYQSSSPLGSAYAQRGTADALFYPDGTKIAVLLYSGDQLTWQPEMIARRLHELACDHLPYVAGQPYWRNMAEDPYNIRAKVEGFCATRQTEDRLRRLSMTSRPTPDAVQ